LQWDWDKAKDTANRRKHGLPLSLGVFALADPLALSRLDDHPDGERWNTVCQIENVLLFVVHTWADEADKGRIISVRKATKHERKAYENG
jgi:uncharacterized DUF497 family protein